MWIAPYRGSNCTLYTVLTPDDCFYRLTYDVLPLHFDKSGGWQMLRHTSLVMRRVDGSQFILRIYLSPKSLLGFWHFYGTIGPNDTGSVITGYYGLNRR